VFLIHDVLIEILLFSPMAFKEPKKSRFVSPYLPCSFLLRIKSKFIQVKKSRKYNFASVLELVMIWGLEPGPDQGGSLIATLSGYKRT
jgi:hypothetical protein